MRARLTEFAGAHGGQFVVFLIVGALTAALQLGAFTLLYEYAEMDYRVATSLAYALAVAFHFLMNRNVTFRSKSANAAGDLSRYLVLVALNYLINLGVIVFVVQAAHGDPVVGAAAAIAVTVGVTYVLSRFWVFSAQPETHTSPRSKS